MLQGAENPLTDESGEPDIIKLAQSLYERDESAWSSIYDKGREDIRFQSDEKDAQWDSKDLSNRETTGRPAISVDQLSQFVHQVVNDIKMNTPAINIAPDDSEADDETAEIFKGKIKDIEYVSGADVAYDTAATFSVKGSIGYIRIDHDYCDDDSFNQELQIKRVVNPFAVFLDSESIEIDGSDSNHGLVLDQMLVSEFKERWPKATVSCFQNKNITPNAKDDEKVTVAEFFLKKQDKKKVMRAADGSMQEWKDGDDENAKTREIKKTKIMRYRLSGDAILESTTFPGKYIPLVPVYGEEAWENGERKLFSLIRKSKGAQRMFNFMKSNEIETLMKQPIAPIMVPEGAIEDYKADWIDPSKSMALRYKQFDANGNAFNKPERLAPPTIPTGFANASRDSVDLIKASLGMYNASVGLQSNETSGIAIQRRQQEGDVANYHFSDNLVKSITHVGRILVFAIPEIYDTARVIRTIGEEDEPKQVGINGAMVDGQKRHFDLTKGKYSVRVTTGASFTTKRQEAAQFFSDIVKQQPELMQVMGDLLFKYSDFSGAPAMANRMKKVVNPKFLEPEERAKLEQENKESGTPDPEKEQMGAMIQQLQAALAEATKKAEGKEGDQMVKAQDNQAKQKLGAAQIMLDAHALDIKEQEVSAKIALDAQNAKIDQLLTLMQTITASMPHNIAGDIDADDAPAIPAASTQPEEMTL